MWTVKLCGCVLVTLCCGLMGLDFASRLVRRERALEMMVLFLNDLCDRVRLDGREAPELLCVGLPDGVEMADGAFRFSPKLCLNEDDRAFFCFFTEDFGMGDTESVCRRIAQFGEMLERRRQAAATEKAEKRRLFSVCGWLTGILLGLLWI